MIDSTFKTKGQTSAKALSQFSIQFQAYLRNILNLVQKHVNSQAATNSNAHGLGTFSAMGNSSSNYSNGDEISSEMLLNFIDELVLDPSKLILKLNAMCILYHHLFGNLDQKLFATIIETNTKVSTSEKKSFSIDPDHSLH